MTQRSIAQQCADKIWSEYLRKKQIADSRRRLSVEDTAPCNHVWRAYFGLREIFDYCIKCNDKKQVRP